MKGHTQRRGARSGATTVSVALVFALLTACEAKERPSLPADPLPQSASVEDALAPAAEVVADTSDPTPSERLSVSAHGADAGESIEWRVCSVVRGEPGTVVAQASEGAALEIDGGVRGGDRLFVYADDHEVAIVELGVPHGDRVEVQLERALEHCLVRVFSPDGEPTPATLTVSRTSKGKWGVPEGQINMVRPVQVEQVIAVDESGVARVAVPTSVKSAVAASVPGMLVGPTLDRPMPGGELRFDTVSTHDTVPDVPGLQDLREVRVEMLADRGFACALPPHILDVVEWSVATRTDWLQVGREGARVSGLAPVPFHVFGAGPPGTFYAQVSPSGQWTSYGGCSVGTSFPTRPSVAGESVPDGTWVTPGRLHMWALHTVLGSQRYRRFRAVFGATPSENERSAAEAGLPVAPTYTLWHESKGVAYWDGVGPVAAWEPASVHLSIDPDHEGSTHVRLVSSFGGSGRVMTSPINDVLTWNLGDRNEWNRPGLPIGRYVLSVRGRRGGSGEVFGHRRYVDLTAEAPSLRFRVSADELEVE